LIARKNKFKLKKMKLIKNYIGFSVLSRMPKPIKQTCVNEPFFTCSCGKYIQEKSKKALDRKMRLHFKATGCDPNGETREVGTIGLNYGFDARNVNIQGLAVALATID
jgi:hypothetical protein